MSRFEGPRGLIGYARVETAEQQTVEVQQSSAVLSMTINGEVAGPFVWLRVTRSESATFAHLTVDDAQELRDALSAWLADFGGEQADRESGDAEEVEAAARVIWGNCAESEAETWDGAPYAEKVWARGTARAALLAAQGVRNRGN